MGSWMVRRGLWHQRQQNQQDRDDQNDHDGGRPQKAGVSADMLRIVHGGAAAGRVDGHERLSLADQGALVRGLGIARLREHQAPLWMRCCGTSAPEGGCANAFSPAPPHAFMAATSTHPRTEEVQWISA